MAPVTQDQVSELGRLAREKFSSPLAKLFMVHVTPRMSRLQADHELADLAALPNHR